jgi:hypothetical protein
LRRERSYAVTGASCFAILSKEAPHLITSYDKHSALRTESNLGPHEMTSSIQLDLYTQKLSFTKKVEKNLSQLVSVTA